MTAQLPLPIDWHDVDDEEPEPRRATEPRFSRLDLWACGLDADQLQTMTTIPTGDFL